jgi:prepilin-type N-terminal cleavage/methylation domain-containing protein
VKKFNRGFTIVELLIVIVVIGILAAVAIVAYNGITSRALDASMQSDLENTKSAIVLSSTTNNGKLPPDSSTFQASNGGTYQYSFDNIAGTFCVTETIGTRHFYISDSSTPQSGTCPGQSTSSYASIAWTDRSSAGSKSWRGIATSADGKRLLAAPYNDYLLQSTDSGATWSSLTAPGQQSWYSAASSSDGTKLFAVSASSGGRIYRSTDSGATWSTVGPTKDFRNVSVSTSGSVVVASPYSGYPSLSTDGGATWSDANTSNGSKTITQTIVSGDGSTLYEATFGDLVYKSINAGTSWSGLSNYGYNYQQIATSSNGAKLIGGIYDTVYVSNDGGATKTSYSTPTCNNTWTGLSMSSDGAHIIGSRYQCNVYTSNDSGATWTTQTSLGTGSWQTLAASPDISNISVLRYGGLISTGVYN